MSSRLDGRLDARWAACWVDLLEPGSGDRALVVEHAPGRAATLLEGRVAQVEVVGPGDRIPGGSRQLVVLDGTWSRRDEALATLDDDGIVAVVLDNTWSPLRALDRCRGRPAGPTGPSLSAVRRRLAADGISVEQVFGLLRTSVAPGTAFELGARRVAEAVLRPASTHFADRRAAAARALARAPAPVMAALVPARLVVGRRGVARSRPMRVTGRLGYEHSDEVKVIRGDPPVAVDKRHPDPAEGDAEVEALRAAAAAGFDLVAPVLDGAAPGWVRIGWLRGETLPVSRLTDDEVCAWVERAACVLGRLQAQTAAPDGSVLVHGDYWLGNVLVDGEDVIGVIDWSGAHRGSAAVDLAHLLGTVEDLRPVDADLAERLGAAAARGVARGRAVVAPPP